MRAVCVTIAGRVSASRLSRHRAAVVALSFLRVIKLFLLEIITPIVVRMFELLRV